MASKLHVYLFGDQTSDVSSKLDQLLHITYNPILRTFFEQVHSVLQAEIGRLEARHECKFPRFSNLKELLLKHVQKEEIHPAFHTALLCACQLGEFISQHSDSELSYPDPSSSYLLGICTGAIAAATVSCARSVTELLPLAVHAVGVSFRMGLCAAELGDRIEPQPKNNSWSFAVAGISGDEAEKALTDFTATNRYPAVFRPFVSAYSHKGVTITAPPSVLAKLRLTPAFRGKKIVTLPVHVPSHAPHLFTSQDIDSVLDTTLTEAWASYYSQIPLVSCSTAKLLNPGSFGMVLRSAVDRSLRQPVHLDTIVEGLPEILLSSPINHISLISVGPRIEGSLSVALRNSINSNVSHGSNKPTLEVITPKALDEESSRSPLQVTSKIAICGLGGRFPDADSPEALWNLLYQGRDVVAEVPPNRWDIKSHVDSTGKTKNTSSVPWGCWIRDPGLFDARFFGISPKEAPAIDPAQRIALMATQEAMDNAGIVVDSTPSTQKDRIGVYLGVSSNDWCETNSCQQIGTHSIVGGIRPFISGRVNYCFKFGGPSYVIDTACSSSLAAIQLACNALRLGDVDTAVAGGTNVITNPDGHAALDRGFFLSKTGNCKTFDDNADGYCRGEGVGVVILKRLEDALQDGDPIQVVIADIKTNHSAEADSITRPHPPTQMALFDKVLSSSRTSPVDVSYIEMHGTGTQHGDAAEMTSCLAKFAPNVHARPSNKPLYIGSTKANIGHGEAVSGVSSLAKVIFMMQHNTIPPHAGIKTKINHHFPTDLKERNIHIAMEPTAWPRGDKPRVVLLNNFSAPGGNTAMILEEPPTEQPLGADDPRTSHVVCVSAKCATSLSGNLKSIIDYIDGNPAASDDRSFLANLSYTTTARRQHHAHRVCVSGHSMGEIRQNIQVSLDKKQGNTRPIAAPKLVFAFTGQGSQYAGMGKHLMSFSTFRKDIRHFNQISQMLGYPSFEHVFLDEATALDSCSPIVVQLAMVSLEMALARLYILWGLRPDAVVGHSLGEYAALNIAGVLSDADTIYLVGERARLLQAHCRQGSYALLAVKLSVEKILEIKAGKAIEIACINGPDEVVVGGQVDELSSLKTTLKSMGTRATFLEVQYAFHTSQVDPILPLFLQCAQVVSFKYPRIQIISPLLGGALPNTHVFDANYLMRHCRETVNIHAALTSAYFQDRVLDEKSVFLEIGAQPVVSRMAKASLGKHITAMHSLQHGRDLWPLITDMLAHLYCSGHEINWASYQRDFKGGMRVLKLPAYSWDLKDYWIQYVEDWALRKGDPLPTIEELQKSCQESMESRVKAVALQAKIEGSTTVHNIVKEESNNDSTSTYIVVQSDVSRPDLLPIVQGHFVNGIPLCTPSVYAEISMAVGKYLREKYLSCESNLTVIDVADMEVERALIAKGKGPQFIRAAAKIDWQAKSGAFSFFSADAQGNSIVEHATCNIYFRDRSEMYSLVPRRQEQLSLMANLNHDVHEGKAFRLKTDVSFKMIAGLAKFHSDYRSTGHITLNGTTLEAQSTVSFSNVKRDGNFICHPAIIDGFTQIAGFTMNAKGTTDLDREVYVNRGWDSLQIFKDVSYTATYQLYVKMVRLEGTIYKGDVIVLDDEGVTASFKGVALRGIPRKAFNMVLQAAVEGRELNSPKAPASNLTDSAVTAAAALPVALRPPVVRTVASTASVNAHGTEKLPVQERPAKMEIKKTPPIANVQPSIRPPHEPKSDHKWKAALAIVLEETGLSADEVTDQSTFADLGVDSLMSMVINSRFREELELDIEDESNSIFITYPTIGLFKKKMSGYEKVGPFEAENKSLGVPDDSNVPIPTPTSTFQGSATVFATELPQEKSEIIQVTSTPQAPTANIETPANTLFSKVLDITADETGVDIMDLRDECLLADIGVDSLLSMVIASRIREELDVEIDSDNGFFITFPTVKHLRDYCTTIAPDNLNKNLDPASSLIREIPQNETEYESIISHSGNVDVFSLPDDSYESNVSSGLSDLNSDEACIKPESNKVIGSQRTHFTPCRPATSVIIQGFPKTASKTLFLIPDGGGSSSSYVPLPRLEKSDTAIIGLNSPYAREPGIMASVHINDLIKAYVTEIQRRQPKGPYHIGGWSSGGVMAFIAVQHLLQAGEEVDTLLILDSPLPSKMDKLPPHFYEYCRSIGLLGDVEPPAYVLDHFDSTVEVMSLYRASRVPDPRRPFKLAIMWAAQSVASREKPEFPSHLPHDSVGLSFMVVQRTDFGPSGWETLMPPNTEIITDKVDSNHFEMMKQPAIAQVGRFIDRIMK